MAIITKVSFIDLESKFIRTNRELPTTKNTSRTIFMKKMVILKSDCLHDMKKKSIKQRALDKCQGNAIVMSYWWDGHIHMARNLNAQRRKVCFGTTLIIGFFNILKFESYLKHQSLLSNKSIWWQVHEEGEDFWPFYLFKINLAIGTKRVTPFRAIFIKKLKDIMKC